MIDYLHEILVEIPTICTSLVMSVIAPVQKLSIPSIHPSDNKCHEILDKLPSTNYGEKNSSEIMAKFPDDVTLTIHQVKFLEKTPGNFKGLKC